MGQVHEKGLIRRMRNGAERMLQSIKENEEDGDEEWVWTSGE